MRIFGGLKSINSWKEVLYIGDCVLASLDTWNSSFTLDGINSDEKLLQVMSATNWSWVTSQFDKSN